MEQLRLAFVAWLARTGKSTDTDAYSDQEIRDLTWSYKRLNGLDGDQVEDLRLAFGVIY